MKNNNFNITIKQIAEICGVSAGTVDRALNHRTGINPLTRERILDVAGRYGYRSEIHTNPYKTIGMIVFNLRNEYFSNLIEKLEKHLKSLGYALIVSFTEYSGEEEINSIYRLYYMGVRGIILFSVRNEENYSRFLNTFPIPFVAVGNKIEHIPYVGINNFQAMADVTNYIIRKNYQKICYLTTKLPEDKTYNINAQAERLKGFLHCVGKHDIAYEIHDNPDQIERSEAAYLCSTDYYACKLIRRFHSTDHIMGFDNISTLDHLGLKIDSVSYDTTALIESICKILFLGSRQDYYVEHKIVERGSMIPTHPLTRASKLPSAPDDCSF